VPHEGTLRPGQRLASLGRESGGQAPPRAWINASWAKKQYELKARRRRDDLTRDPDPPRARAATFP